MKVSVITCVLNSEKYIARCITSVMNQSFDDIEHIIIDGMSNDKTIEIIKSTNINCIIFSAKDFGIYDAFSKGVGHASGEIINILNSDDYYSHNDVVRQAVHFMNLNQLDLCHGRVAHVNASGNIVHQVGRNVTKKQLIRKQYIAHPTVFVRRNVYDSFGSFSIGFRVAGDYDFLLRVWDRISIGFIPEVMVYMQIGGAGMSNPQRGRRECAAAQLLHGASPTATVLRMYWHHLTYSVFFSKRYRDC